nr:monovalent cation/H(+) antiporter subunit G [Ornithinimicrobium sp. HY1745]
MDSVTDGIGMVLILFGALLCLTAAIGLLRFRDLLTRMHAATKPQVLGVLLVLLGVALSKESGLHIGMLLLVGVFQMLTIPVGAHMVGRAGFRTGQVAPSDVHLGPPADHAPSGKDADGGDATADEADGGEADGDDTDDAPSR